MERFRSNPIGSPPVPQICKQHETVSLTQLHMLLRPQSAQGGKLW